MSWNKLKTNFVEDRRDEEKKTEFVGLCKIAPVRP